MPFVALYAAVSALGTAAYCVLWIDFSWPVLNCLWLFSIPFAGVVLGIKLNRQGVDPSLRSLLLAHAPLCLGVAAYTTVWGALTFLITGDLPPRPPGAVPVSLLPLAPYSTLVLRPIGNFQKFVFAFAAQCVLLPCMAVTAWWALGHALFRVDPGPAVFEQTFRSPSTPVLARLEVRHWSGGIFPDTQGRVWLHVSGLPIRQLVYQYWTDRGWHVPSNGVVRWKSARMLQFTLPSDSHGGAAGPLLGLRAEFQREEDR